MKKDAILQVVLLDEVLKISLGRALTVNMKVRLWNLVANSCKSLDGYVQALMPVKSTVIEEQELVFAARLLLAAAEDGTIRIIENHGALIRTYGARQQAVLPDVIGYDHVT